MLTYIPCIVQLTPLVFDGFFFFLRELVFDGW